tara:strand:+ start:56695 stop:58281 length:1587 start_codon:yes stop_codon:yes gene_type:complete
MVRKLLLLVLLGLLVGCATAGKKSAKRIRSLVKHGDFRGALAIAHSDSYYSGKESHLLKLLDIATLHHLQGDYYQSLKIFDEAKKLSDKLFTVSISKKVSTFFTNDLSDNYYGEVYERSYIRFYQALNHFILYTKGEYEQHQKDFLKILKKKLTKDKVEIKPELVLTRKLTDKEKRNHLVSARATLLEWDSALDGYKSALKGQVTYKEDMSAKAFGGYIHESMNTVGDKNIAKGLYREGKDLLIKNYSAYPAYNQSYKKYKENFESFPKLGKKKVEKNFISKSTMANQLISFLDERKKKAGGSKPEITVLINEGFIGAKNAKKIKIPIGLNTLPPGISNKRDFTSFLRKVLSVSSATAPYITFELPSIREAFTRESKEILIKDLKGKVVARTNAVLINPLSEIAFNTLDQQMSSVKTKIGLRVASKHIAALAASYIGYRSSVKRGQNEFLASALAGGSYAIANKGIEASEQADLRHWTTLPASVRMARLNIPYGKYKVYLKGALKEFFIEDIEVSKSQKNIFIKKRLF